MRPNLKQFRRFPLLRGMTAVAVILGVGLSLLMAASPSLHHRVHADAGEADHQCVATLLSRDHFLPVDIAPIRFEHPPGLMIGSFRESDAGFRSAEFLTSPGRGPPMFS